ncbi:GlxA family transcriptional regulator [Inhella crocodyli]|jgi:transcriptional regulator GlxA family with amidase domain|uniref:Helix-turn-helix domain-containing protein n=1 Tax=Inhella crocodyli TaxID=2499851 RepID=A0A437LS65_9BURK|nr:helix-turn-helix domain-containing protein [Inhella crocodyli]RVT88218.1 helix-turn-helix domain-containing protein [Inhella crocodyli]
MQDVALLLLPGASRLAAQLLVELLEGANALLPEPRFRPRLCAAGVAGEGGFDPNREWAQVWVLAPWRPLASTEALSTLPSQLQRAAQRGALLGAVEGGVLWWAAAGQLNGRRACGVDWLASHLQQLHPEVVWGQGLYEIELPPRPVLSCARPLALPDLLLGWLAREHGEALARQLGGKLGLSTLRARDERVLGESQGHALMPPKLAEALTLMQSNLAEPLPTDDVARLVGLSRRQLERLFKQHLDALPSRHYLALRLNRSRELLQRTGQSILQVGLACGFSSGPHFSNAYKAAFGCTPREERARELAGLREQRQPAAGGGTGHPREARAA